MFGIFKSKKALLDRIEELEEARNLDSIEYEAALDRMNNYANEANEAKNRMLTMTKNRDPANVDAIAEKLTSIFENIYVRGWDSAEARRTAIKNSLTGLINDILVGLPNPK